ncbi:MAG: molybdopterin cofactor-binding domain-containing protein [Spirosomataceae bacterium]
MENQMQNSRRSFLKSALMTGGGLWLGFSWQESFAAEIISQPLASDLYSNAFLALLPSGKVIIYSPNPEIGQGIKTAFPLIVAEEMDVKWDDVTVEQAHLDTKRFERQLTGGSGAIKHSWERLRRAGATARALLREAAAQTWQVPVEECRTSESWVYHTRSDKKMSYGALAQKASTLPVPKEVPLKDKSTFSLLGKSIKGVDNPSILTGKPVFGLDYYRPGMLHAQIQRPPAFGLKLVSFDATEAKKMPGIVDVVAFGSKVAIVGKSTWEILKARPLVKINWEKDRDLESSDDHNAIFTRLMNQPEATIQRKDGDVTMAFAAAHRIVEAEYQCPFLPHNPMEPMNFFAHVQADRVELIGPTQTPQACQNQVAQLLKMKPEQVSVQLTKMGGGFGRRLNNDYALEAAELSSLIKAPVKVMWTREDDLTGGIYRPAVRYRFRAALSKEGELIGFTLRGVGLNAGNSTRQDNFPVGAIQNVLIESIDYKSPITTGPWRAPITNFLASAEQSFLDEVAEAAGKDPVQFRLELLEKVKKNPVGKITYEPQRFEAVIKLAAEKANWGKTGKAQGFSVYFSHLSYVAQVAEAEMKDGKPTITRVVAATDCGIVINQSSARNQVVGGIVDGMGHALYGNLRFEKGAPIERNYDQYRLIRFDEVPTIEAYFVDNGIDPTGLGEPALPPTGAALANALYRVSGKRLYQQPYMANENEIES